MLVVCFIVAAVRFGAWCSNHFVHSIDDLIQFSGIDLRHKKVTIDGKNRCGNIQWIPFVEHPKGVNFIPQFNDTTEDPLDVPYEKSSVWYDPHIDGVGKGLVSREVLNNEKEDPAAVERKKTEEEAARVAHKKEAEQLAGGNLHEEHKALAAALEAAAQSPESGHKEVISNAAAAQIRAEQAESEGVSIFPPLLRGASDNSIPKGRFYLSPMKLMSKHGIEHLPIHVQISVIVMVIGICAAVIASVGAGNTRKKAGRSKKRG